MTKSSSAAGDLVKRLRAYSDESGFMKEAANRIKQLENRLRPYEVAEQTIADTVRSLPDDTVVVGRDDWRGLKAEMERLTRERDELREFERAWHENICPKCGCPRLAKGDCLMCEVAALRESNARLTEEPRHAYYRFGCEEPQVHIDPQHPQFVFVPAGHVPGGDWIIDAEDRLGPYLSDDIDRMGLTRTLRTIGAARYEAGYEAGKQK